MDVKFFLENVEDRLAEIGVSKGEFYNSIGITSAAYSSWKTGRNSPSRGNVRKIATFLGVDVEELTTKNAATKTSGGEEVTIQKVVEFMKGLDVDQLRYLKQWADVLTFEQEHK